MQQLNTTGQFEKEGGIVLALDKGYFYSHFRPSSSGTFRIIGRTIIDE